MSTENENITAELQVSLRELERKYAKLSGDYAQLKAGCDTLLTSISNNTSLEKVLADLQQSNERFEYVTRATFDAVWDWDLVNDHLYWGEGYEKIFGYKAEKVMGNHGNHIDSFDNIHSEDRDAVFSGINVLLSGEGSNWSCEYRYKKADGNYAYVQDKAVIIRDGNGKAVRMIGAMQDMTEKKMAEETARITQEKFNSLVNTLDGIVWEADAQTFDFTYVSRHAEKLLGYPAGRWIEEPGFWSEHIHPDDREAAIEFCQRQTHLKQKHQFEYRMIAADGSIVWLADFVTVIVENDIPVQLRGVMVDISEKKIAEDGLKEKNTQLKKLSSHLQQVREEERKYLAREVHDELGQLASAIKMDIDWLKLKLPEPGEESLVRIEHASSTSDLLIKSIRKIASALRPGMLDEIGLPASLEWQCNEFTRLNGIPCVFEQITDDSDMSAQVKTELFRICQESLTNSMRHAQPAYVNVILQEVDGAIQLCINDDGKGFDMQQPTQNFGLMGMRERALSVNGQLIIKSEPGKGTSICALIPKNGLS